MVEPSSKETQLTQIMQHQIEKSLKEAEPMINCYNEQPKLPRKICP